MKRSALILWAALISVAFVAGDNLISDSAMTLGFMTSCEKISTDASGSFICNPDNDTDTTYSVFYPYIYLNSTTFGINTSAMQKRITTGCAVGSSIRLVDTNGSVTCESDSTGSDDQTLVFNTGNNTITIEAGNSIDISGVDTTIPDTNDSVRVNAIDSYLSNITDNCGDGQKITAIGSEGITCDKDNNTASGAADGNATYWCVGTQTYLDGEGNCDTLDDLADFADGGNTYEEEAHCDEHDGAYLSCSGEELDVDANGICTYCGFSDTNANTECVGDNYYLSGEGNCNELFTDTDTVRSVEFLADAAGNMTTGNTETGITVTYQDADNTIDFVVTDSYVNTAGDTMTDDLNMSSQNITTVDCIRFTSGGSICNA